MEKEFNSYLKLIYLNLVLSFILIICVVYIYFSFLNINDSNTNFSQISEKLNNTTDESALILSVSDYNSTNCEVLGPVNSQICISNIEFNKISSYAISDNNKSHCDLLENSDLIDRCIESYLSYLEVNS